MQVGIFIVCLFIVCLVYKCFRALSKCNETLRELLDRLTAYKCSSESKMNAISDSLKTNFELLSGNILNIRDDVRDLKTSNEWEAIPDENPGNNDRKIEKGRSLEQK